MFLTNTNPQLQTPQLQTGVNPINNVGAFQNGIGGGNLAGQDPSQLQQGGSPAAAIPLLGNFIQMGEGLGTSFRGDGTNLGGQLASEVVNPSHGFKTALETGDFKDAIPIVGAFNRRDRARDEQERLEREAAERNLRGLQFGATQRGIALAGQTNNFQGQQGTGFFRNGGQLLAQNGIDLENGQVDQIANNLFEARGNSHEQGGIDLNIQGGQDVEIEGGETVDPVEGRVFSDKLRPKKKVLKALKKDSGLNLKGTYADVSKKLAEERERLDEKGNSERESNSKEFMTKRLLNLEDILFNDQQFRNGGQSSEKLRNGGRIYQNGGDLNDLEIQRIKHIQGLGTSGTDEDVLRFQRGIMTEDLKRTDRDANFFPSTFSGQIQKRLPNIQDRLDPEKVRQFMTNFGNAERIGTPDQPIQVDNSFRRGGKINKSVYQEGGTLPFVDPILDFQNLQGVTQPILPETLPQVDTPQLQQPNRVAQTAGNVGRGALQFAQNPEIQAGALSGINFLLNRRRINNLETEFRPTLTPAQPFTFNDTTSARERKNAEATRQVLNSIQAGSTQEKAASKASLLSRRLRADADVNISELQRRDSQLARHRGREAQREAINTNIINRAGQRNLASRNQQEALRQQAVNTLIGDVQANRQTSILNQNERDRVFLTALQQGDRGTITRLVQQYPELAERFGLSTI